MLFVLALALLVLALVYLIRPRRRFERAIARHVIVHLVEGISLDGVLHGVYADGVTLEAASYIRADDYDTPLDGTQIIPRQTILWVQELRDAPARVGAQNT